MPSELIPFNTLYAEPSRNGLTKPKRVRGVGTKMINMGELFAYPRINNAEADRVPLSDKELATSLLRPGDLLFARQSLVLAGAGKCSVFMNDTEDVTFESHIIRVRLDKAQADPLFYYYYFSSWAGRSVIESIVEQGAGVSGIRASDLSAIFVDYIPLPEQKAFARILGTLDEKIELNRQMNETLETIARAIFKSWFVDFDPVRAKAEGRHLGDMDAETTALFTDSFEDSDLGKIPKGWRVGKLGKDFRLTMGQSPKGSTYNEDGVGLPFYQGRKDFGFRYPSIRIFCSAPTRIAEQGDTMVSVRAPVGDINMAAMKCCIGRGLAAVRHRNNGCSYTYYFMLSVQDYFTRFEGEGTVFGSINKPQFLAVPSLSAPDPIIDAFDSLTAPFDQEIECLTNEIRVLASTRDSLLPKLLSGEIRISDAEKFIEDVE